MSGTADLDRNKLIQVLRSAIAREEVKIARAQLAIIRLEFELLDLGIDVGQEG